MKRKIAIIILIFVLTLTVQIIAVCPVYAEALPIEEYQEYEKWIPQVIEGGAAGVTAAGFPEATLALIIGLEGLYLTYEGYGMLPRMLDIYLATDPNISDYEEQELKKMIYKLDRDGYVYMWDLTYWVRKPIHEFLVSMMESIAETGKYTLEDITIEEGDLINPTPGTYYSFVVAAPLGGITTFTFFDTALAPAEFRHPNFGGASYDTDGSYHDRLDLWRIHAYSLYTWRLDYYENGSDPVQNNWTLPGVWFGEYWDGQPYSISLSDEGIYWNGELVFGAGDYANPLPIRFTGHTDIEIKTTASCIHLSAELPDIQELDDEMVLDDGSVYRDEVYGTQNFVSQIDPYSDIGTAMVVIPEGEPDTWVVGEINPASQSVIQPIPEGVPVPYDAPEPYPDGGLGDLPVTVPDTVDGTQLPEVRNYEAFKDHFPFSLPWDILRIFDLFNKYASQPPRFEIPVTAFVPASESTEVYEIDLSLVELYLPFIRFMELVLADLMLIMWVLRHFVAG